MSRQRIFTRALARAAVLTTAAAVLLATGCGDGRVAVRFTFPSAEHRLATTQLTVWVFEVGPTGPSCAELVSGDTDPRQPGLPIVGSLPIELPIVGNPVLADVPFEQILIFAEALDAGDATNMVGCTAFENRRGTDEVVVDLQALGGCRMGLAEGDPCDDGLFCTGRDRCDGGVCIGGGPPCGGPCIEAACDEAADTCDATPLADGTDCSEADFCIVTGTCMASVCVGTPFDCNAIAPPCNEGTCNTAAQQCDFTEVPDGNSCDDADACTLGESCMAGSCGGGSWSCGSPPIARFTVSPGAGVTSLMFTLDATSSSDAEDPFSALTFSWDLDGDGTGDDTGSVITAMFPAAGVHAVTVEVTDGDGDSDVFTGYVVVTENTPGPIIVDTANDVIAADGFTSLREAIDLANAQAGPDVITFSGPMTIDLGSTLPTLTDGGTSIVGEPGVIIDGSMAMGGANNDCIQIDSSNNTVLYLEIRNCDEQGIDILAGDMTWIAFCEVHNNGLGAIDLDNGTANELGPHLDIHDNSFGGLFMGGDATLIHDNRIHDNAGGGIVFSDMPTDPSGFSLVRNVIYRNSDGVEIPSFVGGSKVVWHNTVVANSSRGVEFQGMGSFDDFDVRNNIFAFNTDDGLRLEKGTGGILDFNLYFENLGGDCDRCTPGANALLVDPMFRDAAADDYRIVGSSPARDSGFDVGVDTNGTRPGLFDGSAPDRGAFEHP